jgi:hypothetical protein
VKARRENDNGRVRHYARQFVVSAHAIQRFRERVEKEHIAYSDQDLGNLLDERIKHAERHQTVIDTRNVEAVTRVFELQRRDESVYYAVVRDMTVVTILDAAMLQVNFDNGSWKTGPMNMPFNRASLRGVVPEVSAIKPLPPMRLAQIAPSMCTEAERTAAGVDEQGNDLPVGKARGVDVDSSDPVADAGSALGAAMVDHARKKAAIEAFRVRIVALQEEATEAIMAAEAAEQRVKDAQSALAEAVNNATRSDK